jgi:ATP-dependent DNA helicase DinG
MCAFPSSAQNAERMGVLVLFDPHIRTKRYGQVFLASLPPYRMTKTITDVDAFFEDETTRSPIKLEEL